MIHVFGHFVNNESGATKLKYGVIAAGIAVAIIALIAFFGGWLGDTVSSRPTSYDKAVAQLPRLLEEVDRSEIFVQRRAKI